MPEPAEPVPPERPPGLWLDPDVGDRDRTRPHERLLEVLAERRDILAVIALGGSLGSLARYAVAVAIAHPTGGFAFSTLVVNLTGAFALGLLMALIVEVWSETRLVRPFLGVGVLGGWTTFSTAMLDLHAALAAGNAGPALGYLAESLGLGLPLAFAGLWAGRTIARRRGGTTPPAPAQGGGR